jgi:hypothetical protein
MVIKVKELTADELRQLSSDGKSPEARWIAARELKLRGYAA